MRIKLRLTLYLVVSCLPLGAISAAESSLASATASAQSWLNVTLSPADARHLLSRTGFDASPESQLKLKGLTRREAINALITGFAQAPERAMPAWTQGVAPLYWTRRDLDDEQRRQFDRLRDSELSELRNWWVDEMLVTSSPQTERMVLFWHDHFATSYYGVDRQSMAMARQNQTFRELGMGKFDVLLKAMIRDPALLRYLNNISNKRGTPNENLARELLERFTLGEGNYSENTVREAARALTGYSVSMNHNLQPRFNYWQHDFEPKTLFGETGGFDADDLVTLIMKQPALDRYLATRYWHWLVADREPTEKDIQPLAQAFRISGHELGRLYRSTLESAAFWHSSNRGALIKSPATLLIGTARTLGYANGINEQLSRLLKLSGQDLLAPPNVAGWQEGAAWITPGRLLNRYSALREVLSATLHSRATESTQENSMAVAERSGMNRADSSPHVGQLTIRLAAEDYKGPVHYRIELRDASNSVTWGGDEQTLTAGWDTARYGMVQGRDQLPWQSLSLPIDPTLLASGEILRVHYLNDAAGDDGDRNLYVGALTNNTQSILPIHGSQSSDCPPPNSADTGDLYCAGYVDFDVQALRTLEAKNRSSSQQKNTVRYASKNIEWANKNRNNGNANVRLVFQDVRFGQRHWPVFSAWYRIIGDEEPVLWLHNQDCWPDCLQQWPDCAWRNDQDPVGRTISIPSLGVQGNKNAACHVAGLSDDEAAMVDGLLMQGGDLLQHALEGETARFPVQRAGVKAGLSSLIDALNNSSMQSVFKTHSPTARTSSDEVPKWVQDDSARRPYIYDQRSRELTFSAFDLSERYEQIIDAGFSFPKVLAPGIPLAKLPGWTPATDAPMTAAELQRKVRSWLLNPAYQVH